MRYTLKQYDKQNLTMETNAVKTKHSLDFECAPWTPVFPFPGAENYYCFRIGTIEGLWASNDKTYDILAIENKKPGNGHFEDVLQWFEYSCRRDGKALRFLEIMNPGFKRHLIKKRGFKPQGANAIKKIL